VVRFIRVTIPHAIIYYHHGELCHIGISERIADAELLLPYVNRIGHAIVLGLGEGEDDERAKRILSEMAARNIGIELNPTCNMTLGIC